MFAITKNREMNSKQENLDEEIISFFRHKKTVISSNMDEPSLYFNLLKDNGLVPDELYQKVTKMRTKERKQTAVYKTLEWLEKQGSQYIQQFWICLFQEHIMQNYPFLRLIQAEFLTKQQLWWIKRKKWIPRCSQRSSDSHISFRVSEKLPNANKLTGSEEKKSEQRKGETKRKRSVKVRSEKLEQEDAGPSSVSSSSQKNPMLKSHSSIGREESSKHLKDHREKKDRKEEEGRKLADLSQFEAAVLPVSCGSVSGDLHKSRFAAGSRSKSIRTKEQWFTPREFIKQSLTDGNWKRDILSHGKTLSYLLKNKVLCIHAQSCDCQLCHPDEPLHQDKDDECFICNAPGLLVCCSECPRAFHFCCHLPDLRNKILGGDWMCTFCVLKTKQGLWIPMSREVALNSPVSGDMRCEYLLLCLYMDDARRVVSDNTNATEERYSSGTSKSQWLDKVKTKLQNNEYKTVREFVQDVKLICQESPTDKSGREGTTMEKIFEKEFDTIFKI